MRRYAQMKENLPKPVVRILSSYKNRKTRIYMQDVRALVARILALLHGLWSVMTGEASYDFL